MNTPKRTGPGARRLALLAVLVGAGGLSINVPAADDPGPARTQPAAVAPAPDRTAEARLRARLLHETIHGALQVMHRDLFREGEAIPSASLEDVFAELEKTQRVKVRWLVVNAKAMNVRNRPKTEFDRLAAKSIAEGMDAYETTTDDDVFH